MRDKIIPNFLHPFESAQIIIDLSLSLSLSQVVLTGGRLLVNFLALSL